MINPFTSLNDKQLIKLQQHVESLVANEKGTLPPRYDKRGRLVETTKMPWMLPNWQKCLTLLNAEVNRRIHSSQNQILFA